MKIIKILTLIVLFCGCTSSVLQQSGTEPVRNYPVFLQEGRVMAAWKFNIKFSGKEYNTILTINKNNDNDYKVKMLADFATIVLDADFKDGQFYYKNVLGGLLDGRSVSTFEDVVRVLLVAPSDFINASNQPDGQYQINFRTKGFMNRYHFKKGVSFPYKLEQIKGTVRKKFMFNDYDIHDNLSLPTVVTCEDGHNIVLITMTLITVR